jgi:acetolactate synthase-1/2/3 large subunit
MIEGTTSFVGWFSKRLKQAGLRRIFGVPGGGTSLDLMYAMRDQNIDSILTAREDAAVIMAGVSGILSHSPGVAFSTKGPGFASATNGLASAALDRLPALLISEAFGEKELEFLSHQVFSQTDLIRPLLQKGRGSVLAPTINSVEGWLEQPAMIPAAMFPSSPDLQAQINHTSGPQAQSTSAAPDFGPAKKLLDDAKSPVIVIGLEAARSICTSELREFVTQLGAPVLCTYMAKGCVADSDPHFAGLFTGGAIEQDCMNSADLIVLIGLDPVELIRKPWAYNAPTLDLCERIYDPHYLTPTVRVTGQLAITLYNLAKTIITSTWQLDSIANFKADFISGMEEGGSAGLSSASVVKAVRDQFLSIPRLAVDAGAHMFSACAFWPARAPNDLLISNGLASMGFAVPAAIASALHDPERGAIAITGDGGFLMCLGELKTAVETKANITIVVFNDGCLSLIDAKREDRQMPDLGLSWTPPDFASVARGFGFKAWLINDPSELDTTLHEAAQSTGPRLVDIRIDSSGYPSQLRALRG